MPTTVAATVIDLITNGTLTDDDLTEVSAAIQLRRNGGSEGQKIRLVRVRPLYLKGMTGTLGSAPGQITRNAMFVTEEEVRKFKAEKFVRRHKPGTPPYISVKPSMYEAI